MSVNIVLGLAHMQQGVDFVLVVVDKFSNKVHFIPCYKTSGAFQVDRLFFCEVVRFHVIFNTITSDLDFKFRSLF